MLRSRGRYILVATVGVIWLSSMCGAIAQLRDPGPSPDVVLEPARSTPGVHLNLVEVGRHRVSPSESVPYRNLVGTTIVKYELRGSGLPQDKKYELWLGISFQKPVHTQFVFHVNTMGEIVNERGGIFRFSIENYHKGEPLSVGLISTDGSIKAFAKVYPFPLQASDGPCHLTLEMLTSDGKTFGVIGRGFPPNRVVEFVSQSGREAIRGQQQVNKSGDFRTVIMPANVSGDTRASYGINSSACKVEVDYEWGAQALVPQ